MAVTVTVGVAPAPANPAFAGTGVTFTNMNGGTNFPSGSTVVVAVMGTGSGTALTSVKMGGVTMTAIFAAAPVVANANVVGGLYYVDLASSTTDSLAVVWPTGQFNWFTACAIYLTGAATGGPTGSASNIANQAAPYAVTLACPSNGAIIAFYESFQVATFTPAWTNMSSGTSDLISVQTAQVLCAGAHSISGSNPSVTGGGGFASGLFAASWNVGAGVFPPGASMYWV